MTGRRTTPAQHASALLESPQPGNPVIVPTAPRRSPPRSTSRYRWTFAGPLGLSRWQVQGIRRSRDDPAGFAALLGNQSEIIW
jgi:hypothetical protein